jgi:phosphotransferase family enzyme
MQLDLRFIVPGPLPGTVLRDDEGRLPTALVEINENGAVVVPASAFLREAWAFTTPVLETHPREKGVPDGEPIPALVATDVAAADWSPPAGLAFGPVPAVSADLPEAIAPRARELLGELRDGAPLPALRPRWARPGWHDRASRWMRSAAAEAGRPLTGEPMPFYLRGISALLRAPTAGPDLFLKAVFPPFHAEPVLTRLLAGRFPDRMPSVVAVEPDEGWLLVEDLAAPWVVDLPGGGKAAGLAAGARTLVEMQTAITPADIAALVAAGSPRRPLAELADAFATTTGPEAPAFAGEPLAPDRRDRALAATRAAAARVMALGYPETVVHGDFHAGNAALVDGRIVIIDWSDAAIGNPAVDLVTWLAWSEDEPDDQAVATAAWVDAWSGVVDPAAARAALDDILIVGAAYQVISYDGIVRGLEPATQYTMAGGATSYLRTLEARLAPRDPAMDASPT